VRIVTFDDGRGPRAGVPREGDVVVVSSPTLGTLETTLR
jgi:hypothetical protein